MSGRCQRCCLCSEECTTDKKKKLLNNPCCAKYKTILDRLSTECLGKDLNIRGQGCYLCNNCQQRCSKLDNAKVTVRDLTEAICKDLEAVETLDRTEQCVKQSTPPLKRRCNSGAGITILSKLFHQENAPESPSVAISIFIKPKCTTDYMNSLTQSAHTGVNSYLICTSIWNNPTNFV